MSAPPPLDLFVMDGCASCARTRAVLSGCSRLQTLVTVVEHRLDLSEHRPPGVIGGPALVFMGVVVGLGTPDCEELADKIEAMLQVPQGEHSR
ncbi:MAG: hypothetical protein AB7T37_12835 [Dehalococcoidia bacterium]